MSSDFDFLAQPLMVQVVRRKQLTSGKQYQAEKMPEFDKSSKWTLISAETIWHVAKKKLVDANFLQK